jgi:hypothetical protein
MSGKRKKIFGQRHLSIEDATLLSHAFSESIGNDVKINFDTIDEADEADEADDADDETEKDDERISYDEKENILLENTDRWVITDVLENKTPNSSNTIHKELQSNIQKIRRRSNSFPLLKTAVSEQDTKKKIHDAINGYNPSPILSSASKRSSSIIKQSTPSALQKTPPIWKRKNSYGHETSDDTNRRNLLWSDRIERVIKQWNERCVESANVHAAKGKHNKKVFYIISIIAAFIPFAIAIYEDDLVDEWAWVSKISLTIAGGLNIIGGFLNPGGKAKSHQDFEALYNELAVEIKSELVKPQKNRQSADVFMQRIMDRYNNLNNRAPPT